MDISHLSVEEFLDLFKMLELEKNIYIFGAGTYGNIIGMLFCDKKIAWKGYIDNNCASLEKRMNGMPVVSLKDAGLSKDCVCLIATIFWKDILLQLKESGIEEQQIYWFDNPKLLDEIACYNVDPFPYTQKIKQFCKVHEGERCFIIGNGPSLQIKDLELLKNEYSMAANKIFQLYDRTGWRPTYYFADDPYVIRTAFLDKQSYLEVVEQSEAGFTSTRRKMFEYRDEAEAKKVFFYRTVNDLKKGKPGFSADCAECVYTSYSITYTMLQLAVYMGFKKIYLLGIDHNYSAEKNLNGEIIRNPKVKNHTEYMDDNNFNIEHIPEIGVMSLGYEAAADYAKRHGIEIYNATRGGKLETFERVDFDSLFE